MGLKYGLNRLFSATDRKLLLVAGRTNSGGKLYVYVNNTSDFTSINGTSSALFDSDGRFYSYVDTRSPLFYDNNDTGYYGDFANASFLNKLTVANAVSTISGGGLRNVIPGGGAYSTGTSTVSGAIVITLPTTNYPMVRFTVKVYTYDGLSFDISCGGHTSGGVWYNTFAHMNTQSRSALNVRFCYGSGNTYVYIGDLGSSWSYPQVFITDVQVGYSTTGIDQWNSGWSVAFNTSTYNNISATHTVFPPSSSSNNTNPEYGSIYYDANNTGYYCDPNAVSNMYGLTLAGGSYFRPQSWIQFDGAYGLYWPNSNSAHVHANDLSSYGSIAIRGSRNGWRGIYFYDGGYTPHLMLDGSGNGGMYYESSGRWASYYSYGNNCWAFGTSTTSSSYNLYSPGGIYSGSRVDGTIFYDSNDTTFYIDPNAGGSNGSSGTSALLRSIPDELIDFLSRGVRSTGGDFI